MNTPVAAARVVSSMQGQATADGAGVRLIRLIGTAVLPDLDPFLLLDEFGTDRPEDYIGGFPSHPHRGFETVTYMLDGRMRHHDNHGNEGLLTPGSVQWMTAGRGLVHSEMPEQESGRMRGFQLWVNLPARQKMIEPRYQEYPPEQIPLARPAPGVRVKVIAGRVGEVVGPITQPATEPLYLDVELAAGAVWDYRLPAGHAAFAYAFEGEIVLGRGGDARALQCRQLAVLGGGEDLRLAAGAATARVLVIAGRPLREPVARHGPFVMTTREELQQAFVDFQQGRF